MKCPFCGGELQIGKLRTRGDTWFIPDGCKTPALYTNKSMVKAGAIPVSPDVLRANDEENWQNACLCEHCRRVISDY